MRSRCAAVVLMLAVSASAAQSQDWVGIDVRLGDSVYRLVAEADGMRTIGSAALINSAKGLVLTAAHCVPTSPDGISITVGGLHAEVVKINRILDLAVLKVPGLAGKQLYLRVEPLPIGLPIAVTGFAFGAHRPKFTFGRISDPGDPSVWPGLFLDAEVIHGQSGGVVIDEAGRLVGTTQAIYTRGITKLGIAADAATLKAFAREFWGAPAPVKAAVK